MFRTAQGQARYFAAYDAALALWPVPVESLDVPTRFGPTHVHACGPAAAPPLVLLPGQAISSTMWYPNIAALSRVCRVYAPDIPGDMGKSISTRPFKQPADFADWLTDLFDALRLAQAHLVGLSYGGFAALRLALAAPERVRRLVLMSPAGVLPLRPAYFLRMASVMLPAFMLSAQARQKVFLGAYSPLAVPVLAQMMTTTDFRYSLYVPPVVTDAELQSLSVPTLLLIGAQDVAYQPRAMLARLTGLIPQLETAVIPAAGHALNFDQPEQVSARILAFLQPAAG